MQYFFGGRLVIRYALCYKIIELSR
jgi:hypothetical protein